MNAELKDLHELDRRMMVFAAVSRMIWSQKHPPVVANSGAKNGWTK